MKSNKPARQQLQAEVNTSLPQTRSTSRNLAARSPARRDKGHIRDVQDPPDGKSHQLGLRESSKQEDCVSPERPLQREQEQGSRGRGEAKTELSHCGRTTSWPKASATKP